MTTEDRYTLKAAGAFNIENVTLYNAISRLRDAAEHGDNNDGTHICRDGRHVAFWSEYTGTVNKMSGAFDAEIEVVNEFISFLS